MSVGSHERKTIGRLNIGLLRWMTIVLPIIFLALFEVLRHTVFPQMLHTLSGLIGSYVIIGIAIVIFSYGIFGFINRLQQKIIDQNRQLSALNDIARASAINPRLEEVLAASLDPILSNTGADAGLICLVDLEKEEHSVVCSSGFSPELVRNIQRAKLGDDPVALEVVRTGRPIIIERVFEDVRVAEMARQEGIKSAITAPLKSEGEVNGILAIAMRTEHHFSDTDQEFLESIGGQLGMAIRNATLYEQSQFQNRELSALLAVGKVTTSSFDLDELLGRSLDTIIGVTSADAAEVWLPEGNERLIMQCHRGVHPEAFSERTSFRIGEGIPGIVAQSKETILVHDLPADTRFMQQKVIEAGFHTFCALPLVYQDKLVAVLSVVALSANAIKGQRELSLLEGIGEWLALAIENTRLYLEVQDLAVLQERERIAREMHDGMAQLLGYINTQTIAVKKFLSDERLEEAREELTKMEEITQDLYADVREGILGLRIAAGRQDGLLPILREYIERYMDISGIQVEIKITPEAELARLIPSVEVQLIRIIQEALTNVRKHSGATSVSIIFERNDNQIRAVVADDGQGFEITHLPSAGKPRFGLHTMRERAEAIGGTLSINTTPGQGTRVEIIMPVPKGED